jgi:hypothetical protein
VAARLFCVSFTYRSAAPAAPTDAEPAASRTRRATSPEKCAEQKGLRALEFERVAGGAWPPLGRGLKLGAAARPARPRSPRAPAPLRGVARESSSSSCLEGPGCEARRTHRSTGVEQRRAPGLVPRSPGAHREEVVLTRLEQLVVEHHARRHHPHHLAPTMPLPPGGSSCSQIATFWPASISRAMYRRAAWYGTPAMGTRSSPWRARSG